MTLRQAWLPALAAAALTVVAHPAAAGGLELGSPRLQQIAITTTDLPRAIAFYRDTLGLSFMFESNGMAFFDLAGVRLMIASDRARATAAPFMATSNCSTQAGPSQSSPQSWM